MNYCHDQSALFHLESFHDQNVSYRERETDLLGDLCRLTALVWRSCTCGFLFKKGIV